MSAKGYRGQADKNPWDRLSQAIARTKLGGKAFITVIPAIERPLMRISGGRIRLTVGSTVLLLHARGAKSGQPRLTPLLYTPHGDAVLLVASKAGADHHPAWYHNLIAHPDVEIELHGKRRAVRARVAEGAEREELWKVVNDNYNGFERYQERAGERVIPIVVLEPR